MSCIQCDLSELFEQTRLLDAELLNLIEQAFLEGQIDGQRADLAYLWLQAKRGHFTSISHCPYAIVGSFVGPTRNTYVTY